MLNEERIILMTRLASYEAGEGKKNETIGKYFRSDYIGVQVVKSVIGASIAFVLMFGLYLLYDLETLMTEIYKMDLFAFAKNVLLLYAGMVGGFAVLTYAVYAYRYNRARKSLRNYYNNLRRLHSLYEKNNNY